MSRFFSPAQHSLAGAVLDRLVPREGDIPGAGEAGTADYLDRVVGTSPRLMRLFAEGLHSVDVTAVAKGGAFASLSVEDQDHVLRTVESAQPEFFEQMVRLTYNGYYSNPAIVEALGLDPRPPQPRGNSVERGDFSSLETVVSRGQAYRDA